MAISAGSERLQFGQPVVHHVFAHGLVHAVEHQHAQGKRPDGAAMRSLVTMSCSASRVSAVGDAAARWHTASTALANELVDFVRGRLAACKCPRTIDFVDDLPRLPGGKIQRRIVREPYWAGRTKQI